MSESCHYCQNELGQQHVSRTERHDTQTIILHFCNDPCLYDWIEWNGTSENDQQSGENQ